MKNIAKKKIWVHTLVFNEENFIWFAVMSVINFVDKVMIWDSGSTDKTVKIIEELIKTNPGKIEFKEIGRVGADGVAAARQGMLEETTGDWILLVDGDEIWPESSIKKVTTEINKEGKDLIGIVVPFYNILGDIYHYQEEKAGQYELLSKKGHLQVRGINRHIPGLHIKGTYPLEGFYDKDNVIIQKNRKLRIVDAPYFHCTHLNRSSKRDLSKFKFEIGCKFPPEFNYPEIFYKDYPKIVTSPFKHRSVLYEMKALLRTPLVWLKRRIK